MAVLGSTITVPAKLQVSAGTTTTGVVSLNELQTVTLTATGGTYTLTYSGQTTDPLAYNASASTVQNALSSLSTLSAATVTVAESYNAGTLTYTITITFVDMNASLLVADGTNLIGVDEVQTVNTVSAGGSYTLTYGGQTTAAIAYNASNTAFQTALENLNNLNPGDLSVALSASAPNRAYTVTFPNKNAQTLTVNSSLTGTDEIQTVTTASTSGSFTLTYDGQTTASISYDASASTVRTRLGDLNNLDATDITVSGGTPSGSGLQTRVYTITFLQRNAVLLTGTSSLHGVDETQSVTVKASGGTYTLTYDGQTTAAIAYNASTSTLRTALTNLSNLSTASIQVSGGTASGGESTQTRTYTITFSDMNATLLVANGTANLSGSGKALSVSQGTQGAAPSLSIAQGTQGLAPSASVVQGTQGVNPVISVIQGAQGSHGVNEVDAISFSEATGGTFTLTYDGQTTSAIAWNASASDVQAALIALSNIGPSDVTVTGPSSNGSSLFTVTFQGSLSDQNVADITATSSLTRAPTLLAAGGESVDTSCVLTNIGANVVYLGGSEVNFANGYKLASNQTITISLANYEPLYAASELNASPLSVLVTNR